MGKVMGMIPGMGEMLRQVEIREADIERQLGRMRAMYDSMTPREREAPDVIDAERRRRIARGAGVAVAEVAKFLLDFEQSRAVMRAVGRMGVMGKFKMMRDKRPGDPVLGAVTDRRATRDPSFARRDPTGDRDAGGWIAVLIAAFAAIAWLYATTHG
jgi:signal recognition particle GTPase